jgi:hypothetical protein
MGSSWDGDVELIVVKISLFGKIFKNMDYQKFECIIWSPSQGLGKKSMWRRCPKNLASW